MKSSGWILAIVVLGSMTFKSPDKTLKNLQKAYQQEAYQMKKYELFSIKAKAEGYAEIADLFHAASTSESVQMKNHQRVIENMGSQVESSGYREVSIKSTKENLKESVKDKDFYNEMVAQAKDDKLSDAKESLDFAKEAEQQHVKLFQDAAQNIENYPDGDYYVSQETGATYKIEKGTKADKGNTSYDQYLKTEN